MVEIFDHDVATGHPGVYSTTQFRHIDRDLEQRLKILRAEVRQEGDIKVSGLSFEDHRGRVLMRCDYDLKTKQRHLRIGNGARDTRSSRNKIHGV